MGRECFVFVEVIVSGTKVTTKESTPPSPKSRFGTRDTLEPVRLFGVKEVDSLSLLPEGQSISTTF